MSRLRVKSAGRRLLSAIKRLTNVDERVLVSLPHRGKQRRGKALLSYVIEPFRLAKGESLPVSHTHYWESLQMAETLREMGYSVDVISYRNTTFRPRKRYDLFIGARVNFDAIADRLEDGCIKVVHLDTAHWLYNNAAVHSRHLALLRRRGVALPMKRKQVEQNWALEKADFATMLGNDFTESTYAYVGKEIFRLPIPSCLTFDAPETKDFDAVRKNFVWFGSHGLVHKGLDLVLETFAGIPDFQLTVCGPIGSEKYFQQTYHRELYELPNVVSEGWVDISGPRFAEIVRNSIAVVYPSAAEGQAGSVVTCLHAGLIPIVSRQTGLDVEGFGLTLPDCSIECIAGEVRRLAVLPSSELKRRAMGAWRNARENYTREVYAARHREVLEAIVSSLTTPYAAPRRAARKRTKPSLDLQETGRDGLHGLPDAANGRVSPVRSSTE